MRAKTSTPALATARGLGATIARQEAVRRFGPRRALVSRLVSRQRCAKLELVWMPFFLVTLELLEGEGEEVAPVEVLVDGRAGGASRLAGEVAWLPSAPLLAGPALSEDEAERRARALLRRGLQLGRRRAPRSVAIGDRRIELVAYPFWMQVFERRRGRYDIRLVDAVGGRRAGAETKRAVLSALAEESRRESTAPPPAPPPGEVSL